AARAERLGGRRGRPRTAAGDDVVTARVELEVADRSGVEPGGELPAQRRSRREDRAETVHEDQRGARATLRLGDDAVEPDSVARLQTHERHRDSDRTGHAGTSTRFEAPA